MADPATLAMISIGAGVAGGAVSAYGSMASGDAQAKAYTYQAGVAQINKQITEQNAAYAIAVGETQAQISGMKTRATTGATKAAQGASGIDVNTGTSTKVRESEESLGEFDQDVIRAGAQKESYDFKIKGVEAEAQSNLDLFAAKNAKAAGQIGAVSSILGSASSVSSKWLQFGKQGVPGF